MDRKLGSRGAEDTVNPMDGVANLADVMLCLAVGIMLALVINWRVDIGTFAYKSDTAPKSGVNTESALAIEGDDIQQAEGEEEPTDGEGMKKLGTVYFDEATGKYYIVGDN
jgi:hypothetical protein